jgi:hypothetical protein
MVVALVDNRILLVGNNMVRVVEENKVELYANEQAALGKDKPSVVYSADEAKKYLNVILSKFGLSGRKSDIDKLIEVANA